jgi:lysophospholipase L1-like esterase
MYRFQIIARTQTGESIGLVGSTPELGLWDVTKCIHLRTSSDSPSAKFHQRYPLWWTDAEIDIPSSLESIEGQSIEYKYVRFGANGSVEWEAWGQNRWIPIDPDHRSKTIVIDDGAFGYVQPYPFGYIEGSTTPTPPDKKPEGLKIVVVGSSVAEGYKAWMLKGWTQLLAEDLHQRYGHQLVNVSELGANVSRTIDRFPAVVAPQQPDIVIIALSLGNEGLAHCLPHERRAAQRRFESGLQQLVKMTRELGALPILGGVYPHGDYSPEHYWLLRDTHKRMLSWGVPVLDWLAAVDNGQGRWQEGVSFDPAHPNTRGHRRMYEAIDLNLFQIDKDQLTTQRQRFQQPQEIPVYVEKTGFQVFACPQEKRLHITNSSPHRYTIAPYCQELQTALQRHAGLIPGIYIAENPQPGTLPYLAVTEEKTIETLVDIPPDTDLEYSSAFDLFSPNNSQVLFYDGNLGILKLDEQHLWILNESDCEFNVHPMWKEIRNILKAMPGGVYEDPLNPDTPFRTLMIGKDGLESRVKVPPKSAILFRYQCQLSDISRIAIVPLGARCAARMLLYKMEYDGPAFPFDLTRTTNVGDVADMIAHGFEDMWNPDLLHYNAMEKRIYHSKWSGLSFAHEVEDSDDPIYNMSPIHERMRSRYQARSDRFWYTLRHSDKLLFIRNGFCDRPSVIDLMEKLAIKCAGKPFRLLLISPQPSEEYADLPNVIHYEMDFNPDRMYADSEHWMECAKVMYDIIESLGVSSKNLFWCPPNPPRETANR